MGTTKHCYIQNIEALGLLVSEKFFLVFSIVSLWRLSEKKTFLIFSHSKSMETINLRGVAKFDPRGMNGTIYVEDH